jgi:hypothetical protein
LMPYYVATGRSRPPNRLTLTDNCPIICRRIFFLIMRVIHKVTSCSAWVAPPHLMLRPLLDVVHKVMKFY